MNISPIAIPNRIRKIVAVFISLLLIISSLTGCSAPNKDMQGNNPATENTKLEQDLCSVEFTNILISNNKAQIVGTAYNKGDKLWSGSCNILVNFSDGTSSTVSANFECKPHSEIGIHTSAFDLQDIASFEIATSGMNIILNSNALISAYANEKKIAEDNLAKKAEAEEQARQEAEKKKQQEEQARQQAEEQARKQSEEAQQAQGNQTIVYYTPTGKKYHSSRNCRGLNRAKKVMETTLEDAERMGLTPCRFCY